MSRSAPLAAIVPKVAIWLTAGHSLYSNRSNAMLQIVEDTVGVHDFLLTPCSYATFDHFYPHLPRHRGCFGKSSGGYGALVLGRQRAVGLEHLVAGPFAAMAQQRGVTVAFPSPGLCADNAAMLAVAGDLYLASGRQTPLALLDAIPTWPLELVTERLQVLHG